MPHTVRTNAVEVVTVGELTKGELRRFLDDCERAGITDDVPVSVSRHPDAPTALRARTDFGTGPVPGYGYPTADPDTERLVLPLRPNDRAAHLFDGELLPGTVEEVTGDLIRWRSDREINGVALTVNAPPGDFVRLDPPVRRSIGRLQP